jgi:aryl-alcohol dehydrogenase-like predicted oxidoreductase
MALTPFDALGSGTFKTQKERESRVAGDRMALLDNEHVLKVSAAVEKLGVAKGGHPTAVALAYVIHKTPNVYPIVSGRKIEHLKSNMEALSLQLSDEEPDEIDTATDLTLVSRRTWSIWAFSI